MCRKYPAGWARNPIGIEYPRKVFAKGVTRAVHMPQLCLFLNQIPPSQYGTGIAYGESYLGFPETDIRRYLACDR